MNTTHSRSPGPDFLWDEIAPDEHVLQVYKNDTELLDALSDFVLSGLKKNEACIVIATDRHSRALESRLVREGVDMITLISDNRYIPLNAERTLSKFMINGWPEESVFRKTIAGVLMRARGPQKRSVRAFGEMVAILWDKGHKGATLQLENLWNGLNQEEKFALFCAYPASGFKEDLADSVKNICCAHSKMYAAIPA